MSSPNLGLGNSPTISLLEGRRRLEFSICSFVKFDSFLWSKSMSLYLIGKKRKEKTNPWRIVCLEWFERLLSGLVIGRLWGNENDYRFYFYFLFFIFIFIYSLLEFDSLLRSRSFNWLCLVWFECMLTLVVGWQLRSSILYFIWKKNAFNSLNACWVKRLPTHSINSRFKEVLMSLTQPSIHSGFKETFIVLRQSPENMKPNR